MTFNLQNDVRENTYKMGFKNNFMCACAPPRTCVHASHEYIAYNAQILQSVNCNIVFLRKVRALF